MDEHYYEYRTGQTKPEKSSRGLVAFLLICVIFLCGVVSVLGMMNIHLLSKLRQANEPAPLSFSREVASSVVPEGSSLTVAGFTFQELPELYQQVYELPDGLYVTMTILGGPVMPGDVLTQFDGEAVTSLAELDALYKQKKIGDTLWFTFSREGETFSYSTQKRN